MNNCEPSKADWKLFRERMPEWQEKYMARLCDEYAAILTGKDEAAKRSGQLRNESERIKNVPV